MICVTCFIYSAKNIFELQKGDVTCVNYVTFFSFLFIFLLQDVLISYRMLIILLFWK